MNALRIRIYKCLVPAIAAFSSLAVTPAFAQVPVDDTGAPLADYESFEPDTPAGNEDIPLLTGAELQELVGPIALYPDDLLAIVLPASTYPLQLVQAQRFLEDLEQDPSLEPDEAWDDSVIALLNYPEVLQLLNEDLDWTWRLGEAVVAQQGDVVGAVESFRDRAYAAGNLKSDSHQTVARNDGNIEITPVEDDVIYVPYYEPERVVVYQPRPVYRYYPRAYPVYYYPYPVGHAFHSGFFWGVTTAFTVGWLTDSVHVIHHSYHGHPYYGRHYWNGWWYRRPTIHVHNHYYSRDRYSVSRNRYSRGDHWRPRHETRRRLHNQRITHSNYYTGRDARHRSFADTTIRPTTRNVRRTHNERPLPDRHQSNRSRSVSDDRRERDRTRVVRENRRHERQAAVPAQTRQAPRRTARSDRNSGQPQRARFQPRQAQPERNREHGQRTRIQREQRQQETTARRDHAAAERRTERRTTEQRSRRASENRQQARVSGPQRQEPSQSGQKRSREKSSERIERKERKHHASSRSDSTRQRH